MEIQYDPVQYTLGRRERTFFSLDTECTRDLGDKEPTRSGKKGLRLAGEVVGVGFWSGTWVRVETTGSHIGPPRVYPH